MDAIHRILNAQGATPELISEPPSGAQWRAVRPKPAPPVRARLAEKDGSFQNGRGRLQARAGKDFIVEYDSGDHAVVRRDIFERTYAHVGADRYVKRTDVVFRYFTLDHPAIVDTLEGPQRAEPGDWIMQGVAGELWPVARNSAMSKYEPA